MHTLTFQLAVQIFSRSTGWHVKFSPVIPLGSKTIECKMLSIIKAFSYAFAVNYILQCKLLIIDSKVE